MREKNREVGTRKIIGFIIIELLITIVSIISAQTSKSFAHYFLIDNLIFWMIVWLSNIIINDIKIQRVRG